MKKYKKGNIIRGKVSGITEYGIFVKIDDKYNGLIHISQISSKYVKNPNDFAKVNDNIVAEILDIDYDLEQVKLSIKNINYNANKTKNRKKITRIKETPHGFKTLAYKLPVWIEESLKYKKINNFVDKLEY